MEAVAEATPFIVYVCNSDVLALLERCYQTTDRYDKEQTSPLASLEARWLYSASLAGLSKHAALSCRSFNNASLAVAMAQGTLLRKLSL